MITGAVVIERSADLAHADVALVVEKHDIEMRLGVEQCSKDPVHLQCELSAFFPVVSQKTKQGAARNLGIVRAHQIGPRYGRIEIEQNRDRFLEPSLMRAILPADEGDVAGGELEKQASLP